MVIKPRRPLRTDTFSALVESSPFRRYFVGQTISLSGTWIQSVGQAWLVLQLSRSGTQVGLVLAAQTLPILLFGASGGLLVDRHDTRRLLMAAQVAAGVQAVVLGVLTEAGLVQLWMVYGLAVLYGFVQCVDNPARQTFALELVGPELLTNAVTLNSINMNLARVLGPALAAGVIAWLGIGACFLTNAASFLAVLVALWSLRKAKLYRFNQEIRHAGQLREGLAYAWRTAELRTLLLMMTLIGTLTYEFSVTLPAFTEFTFKGDATTFGLMTGAMGVGAVLGGLATASRPRRGLNVVAAQGCLFGLAMMATALAPTLPIAIVALFFVGAGSLVFVARANATVQLLAPAEKRGRVMALWTMAFLGTTPVGAPIVGWIGSVTNPRWALATGGAAAFVAAAFGFASARRSARNVASLPSLVP